MNVHAGVALAVGLLAGMAAAQEWPCFRGPDSRGVSAETGLPDHWSKSENVAWSTPVEGRGWSSPIVWGERVFVTTAVDEGGEVEPRKGLYFGGERKDPEPSVHRWEVLCLDLHSGEVLWRKVAHRGRPSTPVHRKNSYASETPVTDGERIYALFGNVGVFAYDFDGELQWQRRLEPMRTKLGWGTASSPVYHDGRLYLVSDNEDDSYLLALDAATGKEVWRIDRDERSNWSTPFVWHAGEHTELVLAGTVRTRGYDLDGKELWQLEGMSAITIATPYAAGGLLYVSSGYVMDRRKPIFAIRPGAHGDISLTGQQDSNEYVAWRLPRAAPYNPSTLVYRGRLYVLLDGGFLACYDAATGARIYRKKRLGGGFAASPWACDGKVFCLDEEGDTSVVRAGDEFEVVGRSSLEEMCMATPAIAHGALLIRTIHRLYCLRRAGS